MRGCGAHQGEPERWATRVAFGQLCRAWAMFERDTHGDPGPALTRGLALANQVLAHHRSWPDALVQRASLALLGAQRAADVAEQRTQARMAVQDFSDALTDRPALDKVWHSQAALARKLAAASR